MAVPSGEEFVLPEGYHAYPLHSFATFLTAWIFVIDHESVGASKETRGLGGSWRSASWRGPSSFEICSWQSGCA